MEKYIRCIKYLSRYIKQGLKTYIKYSLFFILLYSCQEKDCKELHNSLQSTKIPAEDLDKISDLISEGFDKQNVPILLSYDTNRIHKMYGKDMTQYVNNICQKINKDELQIFKTFKDSAINIYFDNIHEGLATWNFGFDFYYINFAIIRNSFGKYYYMGKTDKWICLYLMDSYYLKDSLGCCITNSKDFILRNFDLTSLSIEVKVINQILKEEPRLRNNVKSRYNYLQKIDLIHDFLYDIYQKKPIMNFTHEGMRNFKLVTDLKKNLLEMQFYRPDTAKVKDLIKSNDYEKLANFYWNKKAIFLRKKYIGIIVLIVNYCKEKDYFYLEKHFIPSCVTNSRYFIHNI